MFLEFFNLLRTEKLPVSLKEYLTLLEALDKEVVQYSVNDFYYLSRTILVKHERYLDKFDMLFGHYFKGTELIASEQFFEIPQEWLDKNKIRELSEEEKALLEALGGPEALKKRFEELLKEQKERHEGGNKWIGTGGSSPFGAFGFNPEGYRIGQKGNRNNSAIKVWDKRDFYNLNDELELNTRNLKMALKQLRVFTREGALDELDIDTTIENTCKNAGILDLEMIASKENRVKVLVFFDVGGTMDEHVELSSQLFSAAKYEFKHLEYFYFHNCLYESVWKDNNRRDERIPTLDVLNKYNKDYKVIIIGDAYMSPYEILYPGGSVEHYNQEAGIAWLERLKDQYPYLVWLNPNPERYWDYSQSIQIIRDFFEKRMFPLTVKGIAKAMKGLKNQKLQYHTTSTNNE